MAGDHSKEAYVLERFRKGGYKITPQRQEILKIFVHFNSKPLSADAVYQKVVEKYPNISLDTVYRNLNVLADLDIISKLNFLEGKSLYELNTGEHHHHLVCLQCGNAETIDFCPFKLLDLEKLEEDKKFTVKKHSFNLFGYCRKCSC